MANTINVISKDNYVNPVTETSYFAIALGLFDSNGVQLNTKFKQTSDMTSALVGVTDYGALFVNTALSKDSDTITIACVDTDGTDLEVETTVGGICAVEVGEDITPSNSENI